MTGGLPPVLSDQRRATITAHLVAHSGELTTRVVEAIQSSAHTGAIGDGKIFVLDVGQAVRIRTGETDQTAL